MVPGGEIVLSAKRVFLENFDEITERIDENILWIVSRSLLPSCTWVAAPLKRFAPVWTFQKERRDEQVGMLQSRFMATQPFLRISLCLVAG